MVISLCIMVMNRVHKLRIALPEIVKAANYSPPCEIVIVDYSSTDDLEDYLEGAQKYLPLAEGNTWNIRRVEGEKYFHVARARNCCVRAATGEYIIQLSAEAMPTEVYVAYIREKIEKEKLIWMCEDSHTRYIYGDYLGRFIVCQRQEFIEAGGYDERFNYYAPEEKDLCFRLHRRGGKFEVYSSSLIDELETSNKEKMENYDTSELTENLWVKRQMFRKMLPILEENNEKALMVANEGLEWGRL